MTELGSHCAKTRDASNARGEHRYLYISKSLWDILLALVCSQLTEEGIAAAARGRAHIVDNDHHSHLP